MLLHFLSKDFEILDLDPPNNPTSHYGACHFGYNLALMMVLSYRVQIPLVLVKFQKQLQFCWGKLHPKNFQQTVIQVSNMCSLCVYLHVCVSSQTEHKFPEL